MYLKWEVSGHGCKARGVAIPHKGNIGHLYVHS